MEVFDYSILHFYHELAVIAGDVLTPIMNFITLIGEKGIIMFLISFVLMLFPKTRRSGVCIFGAVCCGFAVQKLIHESFQPGTGQNKQLSTLHGLDLTDGQGIVMQTRYIFCNQHGNGEVRPLAKTLCKFVYRGGGGGYLGRLMPGSAAAQEKSKP